MGLSTNPTVWKFMGLFAALITAVFIICFTFQNIFITIVLGFVMIIIVERCMKFYRKTVSVFQLPHKIENIIGWVIVLIGFFAFIDFVGDSFIEVAGVIEQSAQLELTLGQWYNEYIGRKMPSLVNDTLFDGDIIQKVATSVIGFVSSIISKVSFVVANGILIIPLMFYMYFKRRHEFKKSLYKQVPKKFAKGFESAAQEITQQLYGFMSGKVIESSIIAIICAVGFYFGGLKGWLVLAMFAGLLNIIPYIGPIIGAMPPLILGLLQGTDVAIWVLSTILVAQLLDNLYLIPFMLSGKVHMDPLLSIILILIGAQIMGAMGMIFALPVYLVYKIILSATYKELVKIYQ